MPFGAVHYYGSHNGAQPSGAGLQGGCRSMVMMEPQQGQVAPVRVMVPAPVRLSCSRRCAALPPFCVTSGCTPKTTPAPSAAWRHRQEHALVFLLAQPAGLQQGQCGPALLARDSARPEVGHRGLGDPTRVPRVAEVGSVELGVHRVDLRNAVFVQLQKLYRASLIVPARRHRLELGIGRIEGSQLPAGAGQHPPAPGPHVPGQVRLGCRIIIGAALEAGVPPPLPWPSRWRKMSRRLAPL